MNEILTWGQREDRFNLVAGTIARQRKFRLLTTSGKEMANLLNNHMDILAKRLNVNDEDDDDMMPSVMRY